MGSQSLDSVQWRTGAGVGLPLVPCLVPRGIYGVDIVSPLPGASGDQLESSKVKVVGVGVASEKQQVGLELANPGVCFVMRQDLTLSPRLASCFCLPITGILDVVNHHSGILAH